jgi:NAD(P)-dependent dehydrogenase (short-subunit alcohol dehydrogenase family)
MMFQFDGKTVFITGGGGGIGSGMAQAFAARGARIVLADIERDFAEQEAARLPAEAGAMVIELDVREIESWQQARAVVGPIDVLCNNAGISTGFKPLVELSPETFERVMAINVTGVFNGIKTFAPQMIGRGSGHIVNTCSVNGLSPFGSFAAYSASKFAVLGLSDALRDELAPAGVGVSTLFPGLTRSRMVEADVGGAGSRANMTDPLWLGRAVVRAVENDEPYIITHPEYRDSLAARHERILAAFGEPAQPGYRTGPVAKAIEP